MTETGLTKEFTLPVGLEIGTDVFKVGVMRRAKSKDIIALNRDVTLKQLSGQDLDMNGGNPVTLMMATGAFLEMFSILFSKVVISIQGITEIKKTIFQDMYQEDMQYLINEYNSLNGFDKDMGSDKKAPFVSFPGLSRNSPTP